MFPQLPAVLGFINSGQVRALAVTSRKRLEQLPNVPTLGESGLPGYHVSSWNELFGPRGLPDDIRDLLSRTLVDAIRNDAGLRDQMLKLGVQPIGEGAAQAEAFFNDELARWKDVIDRAGLKILTLSVPRDCSASAGCQQFARRRFEKLIGKFASADGPRQQQRADQRGHGGDASAAALCLGTAGGGFGEKIDQGFQAVGESMLHHRIAACGVGAQRCEYAALPGLVAMARLQIAHEQGGIGLVRRFRDGPLPIVGGLRRRLAGKLTRRDRPWTRSGRRSRHALDWPPS